MWVPAQCLVHPRGRGQTPLNPNPPTFTPPLPTPTPTPWGNWGGGAGGAQWGVPHTPLPKFAHPPSPCLPSLKLGPVSRHMLETGSPPRS